MTLCTVQADAGMDQLPVEYYKYNDKAHIKLHPQFNNYSFVGIAQVLDYGKASTIKGPDWAKRLWC